MSDFYPTSDNVETTGSLFEVSGGWAAQTHWQQAGGHGFPVNKVLSPEDVIAKWKNIVNFGEPLFQARPV
jgi:multifunctional beta-oxidation protein